MNWHIQCWYKQMELTKVRFYYSFLNLTERKMFDSVYDQLLKQQTQIRVMGTLRMVKKIMLCVLRDCPEIFFVDNTRMEFLSGVGCITVRMKYTKNHAEVRAIRQRLDNMSDRFLEEIKRRKLNNWDIIRYVHDFILKNTEYAKENLAMQDASGDVSTICGVFINKRAVCMGISLAAKWLLDRAGIVSGLLEGRMIDAGSPRLADYTGESSQNNHAWNIVNVNDVWHYMDVTMDMGASQEGKSWIAYDYFLRDDWNMEKYVQYENPYTVCVSEKYSFFAAKKVIFAREEVLIKYLKYCVKKKIRRIYFQTEGELALKPADQIQRLVSQYMMSGYQWRYNQKLSIYDFKLV